MQAVFVLITALTAIAKEHVRLIDANALKKRAIKVMFRDCPESGEFYAVGTDDIDIMPTIDPESLRPTAKWENEDDYYGDSIITKKITTAILLSGAVLFARIDLF